MLVNVPPSPELDQTLPGLQKGQSAALSIDDFGKTSAESLRRRQDSLSN